MPGRLLKREHLDLRITPYQVLATSGSDGLIEFVPSQVGVAARVLCFLLCVPVWGGWGWGGLKLPELHRQGVGRDEGR